MRFWGTVGIFTFLRNFFRGVRHDRTFWVTNSNLVLALFQAQRISIKYNFLLTSIPKCDQLFTHRSDNFIQVGCQRHLTLWRHLHGNIGALKLVVGGEHGRPRLCRHLYHLDGIKDTLKVVKNGVDHHTVCLVNYLLRTESVFHHDFTTNICGSVFHENSALMFRL